MDSDYLLLIQQYTEYDKYVHTEPQTILEVVEVNRTEVATIHEIQANLCCNTRVSSIWHNVLAPKAWISRRFSSRNKHEQLGRIRNNLGLDTQTWFLKVYTTLNSLKSDFQMILFWTFSTIWFDEKVNQFFKQLFKALFWRKKVYFKACTAFGCRKFYTDVTGNAFKHLQFIYSESVMVWPTIQGSCISIDQSGNCKIGLLSSCYVLLKGSIRISNW